MWSCHPCRWRTLPLSLVPARCFFLLSVVLSLLLFWLLSVVSCLLSIASRVCCVHPFVYSMHLLSGVCYLLSAVSCPPSVQCLLMSSLCCLLCECAVCCLLFWFSVRYPLSAVCCLLSVVVLSQLLPPLSDRAAPERGPGIPG